MAGGWESQDNPFALVPAFKQLRYHNPQKHSPPQPPASLGKRVCMCVFQGLQEPQRDVLEPFGICLKFYQEERKKKKNDGICLFIGRWAWGNSQPPALTLSYGKAAKKLGLGETRPRWFYGNERREWPSAFPAVERAAQTEGTRTHA